MTPNRRQSEWGLDNVAVAGLLTPVLILMVGVFQARTFAQADSCRQAARIVDQRAQDYRKTVRDVGRTCPSGALECTTATQDSQTALSLLFEAHQTMITACGSGGPPPPPPPAISPTIPGDLVISEIMADPNATADAQGEWFELYNPTNTAFQLVGLVVRDDGTNQFTIGTSLIVPAGGFVVLGNNGDQATNGGVPVDFVYSNFSLSNGTDQIEIFNGTVSLDRVAYSSATFTMQAGKALSLDPSAFTALANDDGSNWCPSSNILPSGDSGTPGSSNPECP